MDESAAGPLSEAMEGRTVGMAVEVRGRELH